MSNVSQFFSIWFTGIWGVLNIQIPLGDTVIITPFAIILFSLVIGLLIKFLFHKSKEAE